MSIWHENDRFWIDTQSFVFDQQRWEQAEAEVELLRVLLGLKPGATVLDLPCGIGRHSLPLAKQGFKVTGVDRTGAYLETAERRAADDAVSVEWVQADMRTFRRPEAFDAVLNLFTSFGYFLDESENRRVAANFLACLRPGGRLVMDMMSKEILARIFQKRDWQEQADGTLLLEDRSVTEDWSLVESRWVVIDRAGRREHRITSRLYSAAELKTLLESVGFENLRAFGAFDGRPYDPNALRLVVVGERPA